MNINPPHLAKLFFIGAAMFSASHTFAENACTVSDTELLKIIQNRMAQESSLVNEKINIQTRSCDVMLSGTLEKKSSESKALEIAENTEGVKNVYHSKLFVEGSDQPLTDTGITAKVKSVFIKEKLFGSQDIPATSIHVETKNGIVYLTGTVSRKKQIHDAIRLAKTVDGVRKVKASVTVDPSK